MTREEWAKLTNEEKRIKVAELCGWTRKIDDRTESLMWKRPDGLRTLAGPPNYLNDLNAMHEAVYLERERHNEGWFANYVYCLLEVSAEYYGRHEFTWDEVGFCAEATAAQRAEAFVLTMEKE